ncbi:MAG: glycerol-3-phosphate dehydrogenase/oxidase [Candidatus Sumerlaeia bacterium]|nr:glycerol-3-phosphate dehydrogenase/oxidase [Candidatus Sumerlaeia bacterium]
MITEQPLDVLIVGGGIVGAGVARDAALRGLRTALVEQYDFASGTSSRSTRLLHGGLRYLAQGRLRQVRQASVEKSVVQRIAPHLAAPLPFVFPTYRAAPWSRWALWKLRIGVKIYDWLCSGRNFGPSSSLDVEKLRALLPNVRTNNLTGAVRYFDGFTNDARLVLDTLRSAAQHGALLLNYCRLTDADPGGGLWVCRLKDNLSGTEYEVAVCSIVNAAGPWAPQLRHSSVRLRLTKGVHLVIDRARLPVPEAVVLAEGTRILFAIPWGERVILGTTDTDYDGVIEDVRTDPDDVRYILDVINAAFPETRLTGSDVLSDWAGLRPLVADSRGRPSDISRSHEIRQPHPGWFDVVGGKLTTYRLMAEQTVDRVVRHLHRPAGRCTTARQVLVPADETANLSGILPPPVSRQAVAHYCRNEWAVHLDDVMVRRTSWHYYLPEPAQVAQSVAQWMAEILDWTGQRRAEEVERYLALGRRKS